MLGLVSRFGTECWHRKLGFEYEIDVYTTNEHNLSPFFIPLANRLPLNMELFLHGRDEMEDILDDEISQNSPSVAGDEEAAECGKKDDSSNDGNKNNNKKSVTGKKTKTAPAPSEKDLPDCYVKLEKTKLPKNDKSAHAQKESSISVDDNDNSFTDFQRTVSGDAFSDTEERVGVKRKKRRPLCVVDDSD